VLLWLALLGQPIAVRGQVVHIEAGASTAERAGGSRARFWHGRSQGWISAGEPGPSAPVGIGGYVRTRFDGWMLELGDIEIPLVVNTDVFGGGAGLPLRGIGYNRTGPTSSWAIYGGATTRDISGPSFRSATIDRPAFAVRFDARLRPDLTLASRTAISHSTTSIQSIQWQVDPGVDLALAAGVGDGQPYAATSLIREREDVSVRAAWIHAGDRFRRQVARLPDVAEADGLNARVVYRPLPAFNLTAGRHSYLVAERGATDPAMRFAVHTLGAQARRGMVTASLTGHDAAVAGGHTRGLWARAAVAPPGRVAGEISLLTSDPAVGASSTAWTLSISERVTQRLSLTQVVTRTSGHTSAAFGGELITNPVRARIEYLTMFVPVASGSAFQQAMVVHTEILPAGSLRIDLSTHIRPDGKVSYRLSAGTWLNTSGPASSTGPIRLPGYMIRGRVIDEDGQPVAGAALRVGNDLIFTNSSGEFFVRLKENAPAEVRTEPSEFLTLLDYEAVSEPERVTPAPPDEALPVTLVVRRAERRRN
jgi:hypothetical protein